MKVVILQETFKIMNTTIIKILFSVLAIACIFPFATPPLALFSGLVFALFFENPFPVFSKKISKYLLQGSVVGLGFGMHISEALKAGSDGVLFTIFSVVSVMVMGILIGKWLKVSHTSAYLIASGTAICGGSAIAAVGPVARAGSNEMSVSLATIFVLNAIALFIFPVIGHFLNMTQHEFGLWAAIANHATSSVGGAGATYGPEALKVATTVKLTRALWIIPLSIYTAFHFKSDSKKVRVPWFILFFVLAMLINSFLNVPESLSKGIVSVSRQALTVTLFFIGAGLSRSNLKTVGFRPMVLGVTLWIFIAIISLLFILFLY